MEWYALPRIRVSRGEKEKIEKKGKGREVEGEWQKALVWFSLTFEDERRMMLNAGDEIKKKFLLPVDS